MASQVKNRGSSQISLAICAMIVVVKVIRPCVEASNATITVSAYENLFNDASLFQEELSNKYLGTITRDTVKLYFTSLSFEDQDCNEEFRLVERLQQFFKLLNRFSKPMSFIQTQLQGDPQKRSLAEKFMKIQNGFRIISMQLYRLLMEFQAVVVKGAGPSVNELYRDTKKYMIADHPKVRRNQSNVMIFRDFAFVQSLVKVTKTIMSQLRSLTIL